MFKKIVLAVSIVLSGFTYCAEATLSTTSQPGVLCVEIGGKKTIAAHFPENPTIEDLQELKILETSSRPWFCQLPLLFTNWSENPLNTLINTPHSQVSVSIFGPLFKNEGLIDVSHKGLPANIEKLCQDASETPLNMYTDSICYATGCLEYYKLNAEEEKNEDSNLQFPFISVILKGGVGVALGEKDSVSAIEIPYIGCSFPELEKVCIEQGQSFKKFDVHQALGNGFFDWTLKKREFNDSEIIPYLHLYNERFYTFINELATFFRTTFGVKAESIYVGGENCRFIFPLFGVNILNAATLDGIAPEAIQLLGCWKLSQAEGIKTATYPSYVEILQQLK